MKRISDLRSVWPHEAHDFTKWLAEEENLKELSDSIGIEIDLEERESSVGSFNVDLYATESGTGRKIIIVIIPVSTIHIVYTLKQSGRQSAYG